MRLAANKDRKQEASKREKTARERNNRIKKLEARIQARKTKNAQSIHDLNNWQLSLKKHFSNYSLHKIYQFSSSDGAENNKALQKKEEDRDDDNEVCVLISFCVYV